MSRIWDNLLSEQDHAVIKAAGYDRRGATAFDSRGMGSKAALLVIDMQRLIVHDDVPILEAVQQQPIAIGEIAHRAIERIAPFVEACRNAGLPIIYTRIVPQGRTPDDPLLNIADPIKPRAEDIVIDKNYPSAFYGTSLLTHLVRLGADTVIVVGNTTSGCVRASVVDARQMGFHVVVPEDYVFDRLEASHKVGLLDMWMKYAAVIPASEADEYVRRLAEGIRT
jgi:nicotinamidase-related amidase